MRKLLVPMMVFALSMLFTSQIQAAPSRLNFMLINVTGQDIVDVRICPTYYPNYISENLLKTKLEPNTRIYIGPNYYGDQRYWNIKLTWSSGYQHTFTNSSLTRYNTYLTYATPYGVRMRQSFEPAFARYDTIPGANMLGGIPGDPSAAVAVGLPEKVNVAVASSAKPQMGESTRKSRDLVFEEDEQEAPKVAGSGADDVKGETIAVKATVELTRDNKTTTVLPTEEFKSGDKVRLIFSANRDGHVYWLSKGTSGQYQVLFPNEKAGLDNKVTKNKEYTVPTKGAWRFDDKAGTETLLCVLSPTPVAELDNAVRLSSEGKKAESSTSVEGLASAHEKKLTSRDLVFEEEDDKDVNTKSQKANGNEPFLATYELTHK